MSNKCLICNSDVNILGKAVIMPFILYRIWKEKKIQYTKMIKCNSCGFIFYEKRFTDKESEIYYKDYWKKEYHKERAKFEWWFTDKFYKNSNTDIQYMYSIKERLEKLNYIIKYYCNDIFTVLDFGGNNGDYKPKNILDSNYFVYDINGKQIDLNKKHDLIILNCVLEHISYPKELLKKLDYKYLYIEVPTSMPLKISLNVKRTLKQYIIDIYKILRYGCFFHMHEHINYFTLKSFIKLFEELNCDILYFKQTEIMYKLLIKKKEN